MANKNQFSSYNHDCIGSICHEYDKNCLMEKCTYAGTGSDAPCKMEIHQYADYLKDRAKETEMFSKKLERQKTITELGVFIAGKLGTGDMLPETVMRFKDFVAYCDEYVEEKNNEEL